jgi:hypothetical protein
LSAPHRRTSAIFPAACSHTRVGGSRLASGGGPAYLDPTIPASTYIDLTHIDLTHMI